jgi:hypothetical protein
LRIAYLILAHNNPNHLKRLVEALSSNHCAFFIHIDKKSRIQDFQKICGDNIYYCRQRIAVFWGDFSQVEASLVLLREAYAHKVDFDYFVLLSGSDYPLQPMTYIENYFIHNRGKEFMNLVEMPCAAAGKPISRLTSYKERSGELFIFRFIRRGLIKFHIIPSRRNYKQYFKELIPYAGSSWWAITREACKFILDFVDREDNRIIEFYRHTICPDEMFYQTILGNSRFRNNILRNLTYSDWTQNDANPAFISEQHLNLFKTSLKVTTQDIYGSGELLFARKFSDENDSIVNILQSLIKEKEMHPRTK